MATLAALVAPGCAVVKVYAQPGEYDIRWFAGVVSVELAPRTSSVLAESVGVGFIRTPLSGTVGFQSSTIAALSPNCSLVLWINHDEQIAELRRLLAERSDVCIADAAHRQGNNGGKENAPASIR